MFVTWDMSLGCLLHLRCHQWWEDCDLVFLHTLLPGAICFTWGATSGRTVTWSSSTLSCLRLSSAARKRGQGAHHRALPCHPGAERVYKGRNTDGSSVSVVKSSTTELRHVCRYCLGGVTGSRIYRLIRGMAHHTLRSLDPSSARRDGTTEYEEETLLTEMNFEVGFIKTKHS